jgi:hypothetical protein
MNQLRRPVPVIVIALVIGLGVDLLTGYSPFPGYGAALGLLGCSVIIYVSKWLGQVFIQRPEDYYVDDVPADLQEDLRG